MLQLLSKDPHTAITAGGMTNFEGVDMTENSTPKLPSVIRYNCGTTAGNLMHKRRKEEPCLDCRAAQKIASHNYYLRNRESILLRNKKWALENPEKVSTQKATYELENYERLQFTKKIWRENNKERISNAHRARVLRDPEKHKENQRESRLRNPNTLPTWRKNNPEKLRAYRRRRRARKMGAESELYNSNQILAIYGSNCHSCSEPIDLEASRRQGVLDWEYGLHLDHLVPLALGGSDLIENIRPSHAICNLSRPRK